VETCIGPDRAAERRAGVEDQLRRAGTEIDRIALALHTRGAADEAGIGERATGAEQHAGAGDPIGCAEAALGAANTTDNGAAAQVGDAAEFDIDADAAVAAI